MVKTFSLTNKVVLITGGYGFLGKAITESLLYHEAIVYVLGKNQTKYSEAFKSIVDKEKTRLHFVSCDVSKTEAIESCFKDIAQKEGKIDVLINNAFYSKGQSPEQMTDEDWQYGIDGSLSSVFRCIRSSIPYFKTQGNGKIINVSSMYGVIAPQFDVYKRHPEFLNPPHYGAAKAGIIQLSKYYASYLGELNINVNSVTPGPFPSDTVKQQKDFITALEQKTALKRIGLPEDLAGAFIFLASEASNYVTGQNIIVDGGWTTT